MPIQLGVIMDPIESIQYYKDSTLAMLWEANARGWPIFYLQPADLFIQDGEAYGHARPLIPLKNPEQWYELGEVITLRLSTLNVILMRKDPPFDMNYIFTTQILDLAEQGGSLIINKPQSLRDFNEKLFISYFPQCCAPTLVSQNLAQLKAFAAIHDHVVFKPLDGMGGRSVFQVKASDLNLNVILETLTDMGNRPIMAQKYIAEIREGDKRILLIDGEPVPYALARIPAANEARGNLAAGGRGEGRPLTERDRWICQQVAPTLKAHGLMWVGLDVIGDYLTEINVTSPTCIRELDKAFNLNISGMLFDVIEQKLTTQKIL